VGYCAVVAMAGLSRGMIAEMVDNGTRLVSGQLQVHADEYLPERSLHETIGGREGADVPALIEALVADPAVSAAAPRVFGGGLVSSGEATVAAQFIGVDPDLEPAVTSILASLEGGRIPRSGANELLVGVEMARQLALREGDTVVVVAPAADGSLGNDLFVVTGTFETTITEMDAAMAFLPIDALQALIVLPVNRVHEIAARIDDPWVAPMAADRLAPAARTVEATAEVTPWTTFRPEMVDYAAIAIAAEWIVLVIIYAIAIFGVANTMLMATYERRFEFALLLALGSTPGVVVRSVLAEALVLGAASLALGVLITFPLMIWWHVAPPDMSWLYGGTTMAGGLMRPVLRVEYPVALAIGAGAALFGTTVLAALFPAWRSSRILPADTLAGR
jgi:ABC-type lipoprotein release transport system permease subunit